MAQVKVLVVGGGGSGGKANLTSGFSSGGGGAGGYQYNPALAVTQKNYSITVGNGGAAKSTAGIGNDGEDSVFDVGGTPLTADGGGGGGGGNANISGNSGGSGGGGEGTGTGGSGTGSQGYAGGNGSGSGQDAGGGGGGASHTGYNGVIGDGGGDGGVGTSNSITGSAVTYCGGGGGGAYGDVNSPNGGGTGGSGGGGNGGRHTGPLTNATAGTDGLGGGGGGGLDGDGAAGGKGVVIIAYKTDGSDGVSDDSTGGTISTSGDYTIHKFTSSGTFGCVLSVLNPTVTTDDPATDITSVSAQGGGEVTDDGGGTISERGIAWGTSANPTIAGSHQASGSGVGTFTAGMTGLLPNTHYYYRSYATNEAGTAYGTDVEFDTLDCVISGNVILSGSPVEGAKITLIDSDTDVIVDTQETDASGNYAFTELDVTKMYHCVAEYIDNYDMYNAKSLPFLTPAEV
jgi:hypothetical protein